MPGFEELDSDTANFFATGGEAVSDAMKEEMTTPADDPVVADPVVADPAVTPPNQTEELLRNLVEAQQEQTRRMQAQLDVLNKRLEDASKPPVAAEVVPNKDTDPLGYLLYQQEKLAAEITAERERSTKVTEANTQQTQADQIMATVNAQINDFRGKHADYDTAYAVVRNARMADFKDMGMGPQQVAEAIQAEEIRVIQQALASKRNPAEIVYALAKRYGHKAEASTPSSKNETAASKLDAIRKGQQASDGVQRAVPPAEVTLKAAKEMSASQLNDAIENNWEQLMGVTKSKGIF